MASIYEKIPNIYRLPFSEFVTETITSDPHRGLLKGFFFFFFAAEVIMIREDRKSFQEAPVI